MVYIVSEMTLLWSVAMCCVVMRADGVAARGDLFRGWSRFELETTVLVTETGGAAGAGTRPADLGYRLRGHLALHPLGPHSDMFAFDLEDVSLYLRGADAEADYERRASEWDSRRRHTFYCVWSDDTEPHLLHDPADSIHLLNYKRAVASLFQIQSTDGEHNETDVSGSCSVLYETVSTETFRKMKRRCSHDDRVSSARRVSRYSVDAARGALAALLADEVLVVAVPGAATSPPGPATSPPAVKARSLHTATLVEHRAEPPAAASVPPAHYVHVPLAMPPQPPPNPDLLVSVEEAVERYSAALEGEEAGGGGTAESAGALLRLLPALRHAGAAPLGAMLRAPRPAAHLAALCRALGVAGTGAAAAARRAADLPSSLTRAYLAGLALSPAPQPAAVADALTLAAAEPLAEPALLAAAAAAPRAGDAALLTRIRDHLTISLARCKDEPCRRVRVASLGNMRGVEPALTETLVGHAEGAAAGGALAALAALRAAPLLAPPHLARLAALAANATRRLEERAAALDALADRESRGAALPLRTAAVWRALRSERGRAAGELRRLLQQRLAELAGRRAAARALLAALPRELRGWDAPAGTSTVLARETGWAGGGWRAELDSWQVAERGALRRGRVALAARAGDGTVADLFAVEVWTRGLASLAGADDADEADDEAPAAGLALTVAGISFPEVQLFDGQGELVGHVWAGTGSTDTSVARAAWPVWEVAGGVPLAGGAVAATRAAAVVSAALDARATVSLWRRTARSALSLRGAVAALATLHLAPPWADLRLEAAAEAAPRLHIHADLDFYDGVALCVRAFTRPYNDTRWTVAESVGGARAWRVRRRRSWRAAVAGRTLGLGRDNDAACRTLRDADADEDAD